MDILLLLAGLGLILGGANFLTDGAAAVAQRLRMPEFVVGLTVVAVGTSTPELTVSVLSAIAHNSDMAVGNVVGSNLFNVFVILGICALIAPVALTSGNIRRDIPIGLGVSVLLFLLASDRLLHLGATDRIGRAEGIGMLLLYAAILWYTVRTTPRPAHAETPGRNQQSPWLSGVMNIGGLARHLGVSESAIAITLVAGGTALPELASSIISVVKRRPELALGNVIGSNIANILLILGASATIHPLTMGGITTRDLLMVVLSSLLLFVAAFTFRRRSIDRWEGAIFLAIYIAYISSLLR